MTLRLEPLEERIVLTGGWSNPFLALDVSSDGVVVPLDALLIINELNEPVYSQSQGALRPRAEFPTAPFFSTDGDLFVAPIDALLVINAMNADESPPTIEVELARDTAPRGQTNSDGLTFDPRLVGRAFDDFTGVTQLTARIDGGAAIPVTLDPQGNFSFDPEAFGLADGTRSIVFRVEDGRSHAGGSERSFTLDRSPPASWHVELAAESDSQPIGDRRTTADDVALVGVTLPAVIAEELSTGKLVEADAAGRFRAEGVALRNGANSLTWQVFDVAGNSANFSESFVREVEPPVVFLAEETRFATEALTTIELALDEGTRRLRFDIDASFDPTDTRAAPADQLLVYLVDDADPDATLIDRGEAGTALFAWSGGQAEFTTGPVRFDGRTVEIDVTPFTWLERGQLRFELLNLDGDTGTTVAIRNLRNEVAVTEAAESDSPLAPVVASAGGELDFASLTRASDVEVVWRNVRRHNASGHLTAEALVVNRGNPLGRVAALTLEELPPDVVSTNASGFDSLGRPYWNLTPTIRAGGLDTDGATEAVLVELDVARADHFPLLSSVWVGPDNRAPIWTPVAPFAMRPGDSLEVSLAATDPDDDPVTITLRHVDRLPPMRMTGDGRWRIEPGPDDVGTHVIDLVASDGLLRSIQRVTLEVVADPVTSTRIVGQLLMTDGQPLGGMRIEVGAVSGLTAANGSFELDLGAGALVGDTLKIRGELFAGPRVFPFIAEKLAYVLERPVRAGVRNELPRPIYLPALDVAGGDQVDPLRDTVVLADALPGASVFVAAGSLMNQMGAPFEGVLSITEVPADRTPAALPPTLLPDLVVTIQPGEMVFARPAPLTLPNRAGWAVGTQFELWSINPTTGEFEVVGVGQVSSDGERIETIEGGIRNSSWHFFAPPNAGPENLTATPECPTECQARRRLTYNPPQIIDNFIPGFRIEEVPDPPCCAGQQTPTPEVGLGPGNLLLPVPLFRYLSCGETRLVSLEYDSQRADSRPIVQAGLRDVLQRNGGENIRFAAGLSLERDGVVWDSPTGGELQAWKVTETPDSYDVDALVGLQADLRGQPSGIYDYTLRAGIHTVTDGRLVGTTTELTGRILHVNSTASSFGVGWGMPGLQEVITAADGSVLRIDGNGSESLYEPDPAGGALRSPAGDFSTLASQPDGRYLRTLPTNEQQVFSAAGKLEEERDRTGRATHYVYDDQGRLVRMVDSAGLATTFVYGGDYVSQIIDPAGNVTRLEQDARGYLTRIVYVDGESVSFRYNSLGLLTRLVDQVGRVTSFTYDEQGRLAEATMADSSVFRIDAAETRGLVTGDPSDYENAPLAASNRALVATLTNPRGDVERYELDRAGQVQSMTDGLGHVVTVQRGADNLIRTTTDSAGRVRAFEYDGQGNVIRETDEVSIPRDWYDGLFVNPELEAGATIGDVRVADLNLDGIADLMYSAASDGTDGEFAFGVAVKYGLGGGVFGTRAYFPLATTHGIPATDSPIPVEFANPWTLADLDHDGDLDLVFAASAAATPALQILENVDGALTAPRATPLPAGATPIRLAVGDLDGDARLDVVVSDQSHAELHALRGLGDGRLVAGPTTPLDAPATTLELGDVDGDSVLDVVYGTFDHQLSLATRGGQGDGSFGAPRMIATNLEILALALRDFDADGALDVAVMMQVANVVPRHLQVYAGDGAGHFAPHFFVVNETSGEIPVRMDAADLNGDDRPDLVVQFVGEDAVAVLLNQGNATFVEAAEIPLFSPKNDADGGIGLGDVDGDGLVDLLSVDRLSSEFEPMNPVNLAIRRGDGTGAFGGARSTNVAVGLTELVSFAAGDLNGDGFLDAVVAFGDGVHAASHATQIFLGDGRGGFADGAILPIDAPTFESLQLVDADGDGQLDLAAVIDDPPQLEIRFGDGLGLFGSPTIVPIDQGAFGGNDPFAFGDFDLDGDLDLAVGEGRGLTLWTNQEGRAFGPRFEFQNPTVNPTPAITDVEFGDFTGDGRLDLVAHSDLWHIFYAAPFNAGAPTVGVNQNGSQTFELIDVNRDGKLDLTPSRALFPPRQAVMLGERSGGFREGPAVPEALARVFDHFDVDGDGDPDLISAGAAPGQIDLLVNQGGGTFFAVGIPASDGSSSVVAGDVDGDGFEDLLVLDRRLGRLHTIRSRRGELPAPRGKSTTFDPVFSQPTERVDELGRRTWLTLDPLTGNRLSSTIVVGAEGGGDDVVELHHYNSLGLLDSMVDGLGRVTDYQYDLLCRVVAVTFAQGTTDEATVRYEHDVLGNIVAAIDEAGHATRYAYDPLGRVVRTELPDPDGGGPAATSILSYEYDAAGNLIRQTNANGAVTSYAYDEFNRLADTRDPLGQHAVIAYDNAGNLAAIRDPLGRSVHFEYDARGRMTAAVDPAGGRTEWTYHADDTIATYRDALGRVTHFEFDARQRLLATTDPLGATERYDYDAVDHRIAKTDRNGHTTSFQYDELGRMTLVADPSGAQETYQYDAVGNLVELRDRLGRAIVYAYDHRDRLTRRINPLGDVATYAYDIAGNPTSMSDELGRTYVSAYDARRRLIREIDPLGGVVSYEYDPQGNLVEFRDELGRTTHYAYDALDRPVRVTNPLGGVRETMFDAVGNPVRWIDELGKVTRLEYDALDRPIRSVDALGATVAVNFDAVGNRRELTDELGRTTRYEYDDRNRLTRVVDPLGGVSFHSYDPAGNPIERVDELGRATRYAYDALDRLVRSVDPLGGVSKFAYDPLGNLVQHVDEGGAITQFAYDELDRLVRRTDALGFESQWTYDSAGNLVGTVDELGRETRFAYDALNRRVGQTDALGHETRFEFNAVDQLTSVTDRLGRRTSFVYDALDRLARVERPLDAIVSYAYDAVGNLTRSTDELGRETRFAYDAARRLIRTIDPLGGVTTLNYDARGNLRESVDALGRTAAYRYDALDRRIESRNALDEAVEWTYDAAGNVVSIADELGRATQYAYDPLDRLTDTTDPLGNRSSFAYDATGNLVSAVDALGAATTYLYDPLRRPLAIVDAVGGRVEQAYDGRGNLVTLTDAVGNVTSYDYDELDRLVRETNALGRSRTLRYDFEGNLVEQTDRNDRTRRFTYDELNRRTRETWLDAGGTPVHTFDYRFDAAGQLLDAGDADSRYLFDYDDAGRLVGTSRAGAQGLPDVEFRYAYDAADQLRSRVEIIAGTPQATTSYLYDAVGRMVRVAQSGGDSVEKRVDLEYDATGRLVGLARYADLEGIAAVASSESTYDPAGRLIALVHRRGEPLPASPVLQEYAWTYDAADRLTNADQAVDGESLFQYDDRGQLISSDHATLADESFEYDANGNRRGDGVIQGTNNLLLSDGRFTYAYDGEGNRASRTDTATGEVTEYEWDHRNRLTRVVRRDALGAALAEASYRYDAFDARIAKTVDRDGEGPAAPETTHYVMSDGHVVLEFDQHGAVTHRYLHGPVVDQLFADERGPGDVVWPLVDQVGSARDLVDSAGVIINHITYDSWGNVVAESHPDVGAPTGFTGREFEAESGLYYFRARYYHPATGQFLSEDPLSFAAGDANPRRYAFGHPLSLVDPWGLSCDEEEDETRSDEPLLKGGIESGPYDNGEGGMPTDEGEESIQETGGGSYLATNRRTTQMLANGKGTISRLARELDAALGKVTTVDVDLKVKPFLPTFSKQVRDFLGQPLLKGWMDTVNTLANSTAAIKLAMKWPALLSRLGKKAQEPPLPPETSRYRDTTLTEDVAGRYAGLARYSEGAPPAMHRVDTGPPPSSLGQTSGIDSSILRDFDEAVELGASPPRVYPNQGDGRAYYDLEPFNSAERNNPFRIPGVTESKGSRRTLANDAPTAVQSPISDMPEAIDAPTVNVPGLSAETGTVRSPQPPIALPPHASPNATQTPRIIVFNSNRAEDYHAGRISDPGPALFEGGRRIPDSKLRYITLDLPPQAVDELLMSWSFSLANKRAGR